MPLTTGMPPSSSLGRPLDLLADCHRRIERCLHFLAVYAARPADAELGDHDRDVLALALRYFRESVPAHLADEEESLFPRMRHATHPLAIAAMHRLAALESDHAAARPRHAGREGRPVRDPRSRAASAEGPPGTGTAPRSGAVESG